MVAYCGNDSRQWEENIFQKGCGSEIDGLSAILYVTNGMGVHKKLEKALEWPQHWFKQHCLFAFHLLIWGKIGGETVLWKKIKSSLLNLRCFWNISFKRPSVETDKWAGPPHILMQLIFYAKALSSISPGVALLKNSTQRVKIMVDATLLWFGSRFQASIPKVPSKSKPHLEYP